MPNHISLPERKALLGKIAVLQGIDHHTHAVQETKVPQVMRNALVMWVRDQFTDCDNSISLTTSIEQLQETIAKQVKRAAEKRIAARVLSSFRTALRQRTCEDCDTGGRPCDGDPDRDDDIATRGGACLTPLAEVFEFALQLSKSLYSEYAAEAPGQLWSSVKFATLDRRSEVHDFPTTIQVSARVDRRVAPTVTLTLWVEEFDWEEYLVLPYVLFHELLIHIPENASDGGGKKQADAGHPFVEGWMDWLAKELLYKRLLQELHGPAWMTTSSIAINELHAARLKRVGDPSNNVERRLQHNASNRFLGWRAAESFLRFLQREYVGSGDALALFAEISLRLNFLSASDDEKEEFVTVIGWFLADSDLPHSGSFELAQAIRRYRTEGNISRLLETILLLSQSYSVDK